PPRCSSEQTRNSNDPRRRRSAAVPARLPAWRDADQAGGHARAAMAGPDDLPAASIEAGPRYHRGPVLRRSDREGARRAGEELWRDRRGQGPLLPGEVRASGDVDLYGDVGGPHARDADPRIGGPPREARGGGPRRALCALEVCLLAPRREALRRG